MALGKLLLCIEGLFAPRLECLRPDNGRLLHADVRRVGIGLGWRCPQRWRRSTTTTMATVWTANGRWVVLLSRLRHGHRQAYVLHANYQLLWSFTGLIIWGTKGQLQHRWILYLFLNVFLLFSVVTCECFFVLWALCPTGGWLLVSIVYISKSVDIQLLLAHGVRKLTRLF